MQRYTKQEHFERLEEVSKVVKEELYKYEDSSDYPEVFRKEPVWQKRVRSDESRLIRPLIVRNVIDSVYDDSDKWKKYPNILTSVELFNISTYQSDYVFDLHHPKPSNRSIEDWQNVSTSQFCSSSITFTEALKLLKSSNLSGTIVDLFIEKMITAYNEIYYGQYIDAFYLKNSVPFDLFSLDENSFLEIYIERCKKLDAYQFGMCFSFGLVTKNELEGKYNEVLDYLYSIGHNFGICIQVLNDIEDLVANGSICSDVSDGKVTYPVYLLWHHSKSARKYLEKIYQGDDIKYNEKRLIENTPYDNVVAKKLISLLYKHYTKISRNIGNFKNSLGSAKSKLFDFIFPHIFLSKIIREFSSPDVDVKGILKNL